MSPLPGVGVLPINAFLLMAEQPVLIDTGIGLDGDDFAALTSVIDPKDLKWVWLTHDDADHTGSIQRVMELARMPRWSPTPSARCGCRRGGPCRPRPRHQARRRAPRRRPHPDRGRPAAVRQPALHRRARHVDRRAVQRRLLRRHPPGADAGHHRGAPGGTGRRHAGLGDTDRRGAHHRPTDVRRGAGEGQAAGAEPSSRRTCPPRRARPSRSSWRCWRPSPTRSATCRRAPRSS